MKKDTSSINSPLEVKIVGNQLKISIGLKTLASAAERLSAEETFQETGEIDSPKYKVKDLNVWAKEVANALEEENEIGESPLTKLLDAAFVEV